MRKLLFLDTSYTFNQIQDRNSINIIISRDLKNFYSKVISIHPVANLTENLIFKNNNYFIKNKINDRHIFYEFRALKKNKFFLFEILSFFYFQIKMFFFVIKIIKKEKISYIKCGDINYAGLIGYLLFKIIGVKYYLRVGSNNNKIREELSKPIQPKLFRSIKIEKFFEKLILKNSLHVFPANEDNAEFVRCYLPNSDKITVVRYGPLIHDCHFIDKKLRYLRDKKLIELNSHNYKIITCISRFEKVKKVEHVLFVFENLFRKNPKIYLFLVGDGSLKNSFKQKIKNELFYKNVFFVGNKNQIWISELLKITDMVISPHTGRALCEAALAGCKIVGYDIDWQSEIIKHNRSGFLAKFADEKELLFFSDKIISNLSNYESFSSNIRINALKILDKNKNIQDETNILISKK